MSDTRRATPSPAFDKATALVDGAVESFWFNQYPAEHSRRLADRIKMAAKLTGRATGLQHGKALDAVSQALRFPAWHYLSKHLAQAESFGDGQLPEGWLDALSQAALLTVQLDDEVALPEGLVEAFERFGESLAMLTDVPKQQLLDGVSAALCGGRTWREVVGRTPLKAREPLYHFAVFDVSLDGKQTASFGSSAACDQLDEQLDEQWRAYERDGKAGRRAARRWVEAALSAQPGFLEGGRALALMQRDEGDVKAYETVTRYVRLADALIPKGYKGLLPWGHLGNRVYHRLLWLQMELMHEHGLTAAATKVARRMLRLNPNDNVGARYTLPFLLLEQGDLAAARRALKAIAVEPGLTAAATRAFVAFAEGDISTFRRELAASLFTLPMMRAFLTNDPDLFPDGDSGFRHVHPDTELFGTFAWPSYCILPGLERACLDFLAEPVVLAAEDELREYWAGYWVGRRDPGAVRKGSAEGWDRLVRDCVERVEPRPATPARTMARR